MPSESQSEGGSPRVEPPTDLTRWRLTSVRGRRKWRYVTEDEDLARPQNMVEKYSLGLDCSEFVEKSPRAATAEEAILKGVTFYSLLQCEDGHWPNDYSGPLFLIPGLVIVHYVTKTDLPEAFRLELVRYLRSVQLKEGGWGLHIEDRATVFGTALNYVSMRLLGVGSEDGDLKKALKFLHSHGGAAAIPQWGKFWLCVLNCYRWEGMHTLFPELWLMPSWVPAHPSTLWIHCRYTYLGMTYLYGRRYYAPEDDLIRELRKELFLEDFDKIDWPMQRDNVAAIDLYTPHSWLYTNLFKFLDVYELGHLSWFREQSLEVCYDHIRQDDIMTNYISIGPITKMINMLCRWLKEGPDSEGFRVHKERVYDYLWIGRDGLNMQGTAGNQIWDAAFCVMALMEVGNHEDPAFREVLTRAYKHLNEAQVTESSPKCVEYYRQYNKGGWTQTTGDQGLIVSDTTAEAFKAMLLMEGDCPYIEDRVSRERYHDTVDMLLKMVNPGGGFSAFETLRGGLLLEMLNPSEVFGDIMVDYTFTECTSSVMQALRHFVDFDPEYRTDEIWEVLKNALHYLKGNQLQDGSFEGCWGVCFTYGTWFALEAFACMGQNFEDNTATLEVRKACAFLVSRQKADGGWGEKFTSCSERRYVESETSLVVNTAWALLGLMAVRYPDQGLIQRGIDVLIERQKDDGDWPQESICGVFNRTCAISYEAFKNIFAIWALGRYAKLYPSNHNQTHN